MLKKVLFKKILLAVLIVAAGSLAVADAKELAPNVRYQNDYTIISDKNLYRDFVPVNPDGLVNAVVEIPTGYNDKWEVGKNGIMNWELKDGKPRIVEYLGYPGNYGMVPRTVGGDGDSLDILVLGPTIPRGTWVNVKIIGALKLMDKGEVDDKLIAVVPGSYFASCDSLADLNEKFPGVTTIVETWFTNYKGAGKMKSQGFVEAEEARQIIDAAVKAYQ
ncbi:MAG TPA: inorganic diphosphatase [Patescibacteria group bacterium]|nr:inorganic diphosphatase [Patescibacteria group bacterium]